MTVVCGHYGVGKTNLSINLALDAAAAGAKVTLVDLDVVNPYFRSTEYRALLEEAGVRVIAPVFAEAGTSLDVPSLTGAIVPAVEAAYAALQERTAGEAGAAERAGAAADGDPHDADGDGHAPTAGAPADLSGTVVIVDAGGDDAGATALGRFAHAIEAGPYEMLYVVNRSRSLAHDPVDAVRILREVEGASHLRATAVASNAHLKDETDAGVVEAGAEFASEVAGAAGLPLAFVTVPESLLRRENEAFAQLAEGQNLYPVRVHVKTPWEV